MACDLFACVALIEQLLPAYSLRRRLSRVRTYLYHALFINTYIHINRYIAGVAHAGQPRFRKTVPLILLNLL